MEAWIVILPLIGALIAGIGNRRLGDRPSTTSPQACCWSRWSCPGSPSPDNFGGTPRDILLFNWFTVGDFKADWAVRVDQLSAVMLVVVTTVSGHGPCLFDRLYEPRDGKPRFFAYLSLFTFCMLMLVTANNFIQMFFGWEGVACAPTC